MQRNNRPFSAKMQRNNRPFSAKMQRNQMIFIIPIEYQICIYPRLLKIKKEGMSIQMPEAPMYMQIPPL